MSGNEGGKRYRLGDNVDDAFKIGVQAGLDYAREKLGAAPVDDASAVDIWERQRRIEEKLTRYFGKYTVDDGIGAIDGAIKPSGARPEPATLYLADVLPAGQCRNGGLGWFKITVEFEPLDGKRDVERKL